MIIAAHAGTGKTTFAQLHPDKVTDFVCMPYKYHLPETGEFDESSKASLEYEMQEAWPYNYIEAIKNEMKVGKTLLIPSVWMVLVYLEMERIPFILCYPRRDAKEVYRQRYIDRGNTDEFLSVFIDGWDAFMDKLEANTYGTHIVMEPHQYLSDVIKLHAT